LCNNKPEINDEAFDSLFREYYRSLRAYAYRYVIDLFAAEDIVQDVFYQVWEKRDQLHKINSIRSYLFTAVFNRATNYSKHKKLEELYYLQQTTAYAELESYYHQEINNAGDSSIIALELEQQITDVISGMPEQCKNVFILSRINGLKNQEIADKLGVTLKAVEKQMTKALMLLRIRLKDYLLLLITYFLS
jgi:RNA polymerase sigma-70 factor, ECF subfamily